MVPRPERHLENVLAVGGKMVVRNDPATGAVRRAFHIVPLVLGLVGRDEVGLGVRGRARMAQHQAADVVGGVQVRVEERGRQRLRYRHVVEVPQIEIRGKPLAGVDGDAEEILDGLLVLRAVEPLETAVARVGIGGRVVVDRLLERLDEREQRVPAGTGYSGRRHHPRAQLRDHALGRLPVLPGGGHVEALDRHVAGHHGVVVADEAVLADDGVERFGRGRAGTRMRTPRGIRTMARRECGSGVTGLPCERRRARSLMAHEEGHAQERDSRKENSHKHLRLQAAARGRTGTAGTHGSRT